MSRRRRVARITINIGESFPKSWISKEPEVVHMSNIADSEAQGPISAEVTDKYGEAIEATWGWSTDGATGDEGDPMITLVDVAEGHPTLAAGKYVRAGDDVNGPPSVVTGIPLDASGDPLLDADGNPIQVAEVYVVTASGATGATFGGGSTVSKDDLDAVPEPVPTPGGEGGEGETPTP